MKEAYIRADNQVLHDMGNLNAALVEYQKWSRKAVAVTLAKQSGKLAYAMAQALRGISRNKREIRASIIARLRAGKMIFVREAAHEWAAAKVKDTLAKRSAKSRAKRPHRQRLAVKREIGIRESGKGVLRYSTKYPKVIPGDATAVSRYGLAFSEFAHVNVSDKGGVGRFDWRGLNRASRIAAGGLQDPKPLTAISGAIKAVTADILKYVRDEQVKAAEKGFEAALKKTT